MVKQYPEWQQAFREAQAERDNLAAIEAQIVRDKEAEEARAVGRDLAKALMHFGIYLETAPETNEAVIDGFTFCLSSGNHYTVKKNTVGQEEFYFHLRVSKEVPGRSEEDRQIHYRHIGVDTSYGFEKTGWDRYLCQLADAFDEIDQAMAFDVERNARYKQQAEERRLNPPEASESDEEKLLKLLESLVRKEVSKQLDFSL